ncbi:MAG: UDP-3-O-(3-hydroxymyristoyl)glucosamine N-acyltransferase [Calditrichaceae bacterium]|nr:UDP-3-O-(3-hydroxymyristoyl)glucosamine N-acyltransferase [Calditrichaceae bacterium]RQV97626.1 MAG: UDP-3-O-(3-hydroxymyristoyl)glucosamine N-acyltransferase [Calditrichota bacterium]
MKLSEISRFLNGEMQSAEDIEISGPAKIESAQKGQITFLANPKYHAYVEQTKASAVIIDDRVQTVPIPSIKVKDAYVSFVKLLKLFSPAEKKYVTGISDQAYIDKSALIASTANIGPFVYIGPGVKVGENTTLYPGVVLLKNVIIGSDCILYPNVSIREECVVGNRVILHNGCVIGSDGFGFAPTATGYEKIPQLGKVIIEDDVEIGANTTIDRATLGETIIKKGTKLDNLIQIAHNVVIGEHTVIAAQSGIAGSTEVGNNVTIAAQVGIVGHIKIGSHAIVAAQSGVSKAVQEKTIVFGSPALPISQQKRIEASLRHLPEFHKRIKELEKEIEE